jgi:exopolysaccharide/PEP-CTERM locus tyrosine autokinase
MSVIETAIKKLQSSRGADSRKTSASPIAIGTLIGSGAAARRAEGEQPAETAPARHVDIDQQALRAAGLLPPENQDRALAQQYRRIKRPLIDRALGRGTTRLPHGNLIMLASAMPGEGKTFMSLNLALSMTFEEDIRVLLVDADVAKPHISKLLGVEGQPGLLDALRDPKQDIESLIFRTSIPGLTILSAGKQSENATELLASTRMQQVFSQMSERDPFRIVLFDSPPLLLTTESLALAHVPGQIVVVVCAEKTPQRTVLDALTQLGQDKPVSLVLNQSVRASQSNYYYKYNSDASGSSAP